MYQKASTDLRCEGADGSYDASASRAWDPQGHNAGEQELRQKKSVSKLQTFKQSFNLAKEDEEEEHEVEAGVIAECLVGGSEPAKEWEGDEEGAVDETQPKHGTLVHAGEEEADAAKKICKHEQRVEQPEVVEPLHHLLELNRDVHIDILAEEENEN